MKSKNILMGLVLTATLLSCTENSEMLTVIQPDGSCYREFCADVDSSFMVGAIDEEKTPFPVRIDSTWSVTWTLGNSEPSEEYPLTPAVCDSVLRNTPVDSSENKNGQRRFHVRIRQDYASVQDMAVRFHLRENHSWSDLKVNYSLDKKFRWFYTYYDYRETWPQIETGFDVPIDSFMTKEEASYWFTGSPNLTLGMNGVEVREFAGDLEDKFNHWYLLNTWNAEYKVLLSHYDKLVRPPFTRDELAVQKDTIFQKKVRGNDDIKMESVLNDFFRTDVFSILWNGQEAPMKTYEKSLEDHGYLKYFTDAFTYLLVLPGKVTPPANTVMNGDTIRWNLNGYRLVNADYTFRAQSRKANVWAFVLTGLIVAVAVGSFFYQPKRKI